MRTQILTLALAGSLGLTGAALLAPSIASAQTASPSPSTGNVVTDRLTLLEDALRGLVTDETLTQAQADEVASTLAEQLPDRGGRGGHGGPGGGPGGRVSPEATAEAIGVSVEELRTALEAGKTLAQVAEAEGVGKATLVDRLVAAAMTELAEQVTAGRTTQAQSDEIAAGLEARITEGVDRVGGLKGGRGHHGPRRGDTTAPSATTPSTTATPSVDA